MGVENNNAVIATTWNNDGIERIKRWVDEIDDDFWRGLFLFGDAKINGITTIVMLPDGSKEGWPESEYGDKLRDRFISELQKADYDDGSSPWDFIEVGYGEFGQKVLRGNCQNRYGDSEYAA